MLKLAGTIHDIKSQLEHITGNQGKQKAVIDFRGLFPVFCAWHKTPFIVNYSTVEHSHGICKECQIKLIQGKVN